MRKLAIEDFNSALEKSRSALTLLKEHQDKFNLIKELEEFNSLNSEIVDVLRRHRTRYVKRYEKLLKLPVNEQNLEKLLKLMASLKNIVDKKLKRYALEEISSNINRYFEFIKNIYIILSTYENLNYYEVSERIVNFIEDLNFESFPNLQKLIKTIHIRLISRELVKIAKNSSKISFNDLSDMLLLNHDELTNVIYKVMKTKESPIKVFNTSTQDIIFN